MIETLILDLDGPLLDGVNRHYQCYVDILKQHGFQPISQVDYWQMKRAGINRHELLQRSDADQIYQTFLEKWLELIEDRKYLLLDRLQAQVKEILQAWKQKNIKLVLATLRSNSANLTWQLQQFALLNYFDEIIVVGSQVTTSKSAEVKQRLKNIHPEKILWIGDTEVDIQAARELGVKVCAVSCGLRDEKFLAALNPDYLEKNLQTFYEKSSGLLS